MAESQTRFIPLLVTVASVLLGSVQSTPSHMQIPSTSRGPPPLPQYYPSSSQRPPSSPSSSLAPTAPIVYNAQRIRPANSYSSAEYEEPYPSSAHLGTARTTSGVAGEDAPENTGFVEPIDFSSLLKDVGSSPKNPAIDIQASSSNPLFASESKDTFAGFFGSSKNPFEELSRLNTASSDHNSRQQNDEDNVGFVDPNVQFRSLFESSGTSGGFSPQDFLGSKSENIGSAPSKGSQTRAYPSFTYSGRENAEREDDDYQRGGGPGGPGPGSSRYRSNYRQVGNNNDYNNPDDRRGYNPDDRRGGQYDDRISHNSPSTDSYDDDRDRGYYNSGPSGPGPRGGGGGGGGGGRGGYERATPRYSQAAQETSHSPQTKPSRSASPSSSSSKNPKCKKVEKVVDQSDDYASFTEPDDDYDPSTYQGRYKRQSRQGRQGGGRQSGGGSRAPKRPMTCYVCEDEHGRYAEKCSYDSNGNSGSPKNGAYFHSESTSFTDNGRNNGRGGSGGGKDRQRRNPGNRQRHSEDEVKSESTTKVVSVDPANSPEVEESEPKVIDKRQSGGGGGGYDGDEGFGGGRGGGHGDNPHRGGGGGGDGFGDPYDPRSGTYQNPTGYEGPALGSSGGRGTGGGRGGDGHGGAGRDEYGFGNGNDFSYGPPADFDREASSLSREFDFSIPRDFDPDVQLRPDGGRGGGGSGGGGRGGGGGGNQQYHQGGDNRRNGPHESASTASNRRETQDAFDVGYNDYLKQNFPEVFDSPVGFSTPSYSPSNYDFTPNYYHRNGGGGGGTGGGGGNNDREREQRPEISHSPSNHHGRGHNHGGGGSRGRGGYTPDKEHTQPSHNFSPPPGFFSEDSPAQENYGQLGNIMNDFSSRSRDGCRKVNKGDMTCYVCRDAKGMNKEECMYASNDPKNKAMAYHEVTEYSSPSVSVLPAPLRTTLGLDSSSEESGEAGSDVAASSLAFASTPTASTTLDSTVPTSSTTEKGKKKSASNDDKEKGKNLRSVKSTRFAHSSTVIVHERTKRSPKEEEYDFDY